MKPSSGWRGALRTAADGILCRSPLQALWSARARRRLAVLAYHGVEDPGAFGRQLAWLRRRTRPIGADDLLAALRGERDLPPRATLVTFDDADRGHLEIALPLLREHGMPAIAFVIAGLLDGDRPPWWLEVRALAAAGARCSVAASDPDRLARRLKFLPESERRRALDELRASAPAPAAAPQLRGRDLPVLEAGGIAIGSHTQTHPLLPNCSDAQLEEELLASHRRLESALGHPPRLFAFPNGDADPRADALLSRLGYEAAFLFDHRLSAAPPADRLRISRVRVNSDTTLDRLRLIVSGLHPALHRARGLA